jgi:lysozyme family protein
MPYVITKADFAAPIMPNVFVHEGGYGWDPRDPGGPTNFGITWVDLAEYLGKTPTSPAAWAVAVRDMPKAQADEIYANKYAAGVAFNDLPNGPDYSLLDYAINSGISRSVRVAQTLLKRNVTGKMDLETVAAIGRCEPTWLIDAISAERLHFLHGLSTFAHFGAGWMARVNDVKTISHLLISGLEGAQTPRPTTSGVGQKGIHAPDATQQGKIVGRGSVATSASAALSFATLHWQVAVTCVVAVAGVSAYGLWRYHQQVKAANTAVELPPGIEPRAV